MGRSAHSYFGNSQCYFLIEGQKLLSICYRGYLSEVFLMMEVKWVLLFECIVQNQCKDSQHDQKDYFW